MTLSDLPAGPEREAALWTFDSFVDDIASCRYEGAVAVLAQGATTIASTLQIPIEQVPLGARVPTKNPRRWEFDDSLAEPDQGSWAKVCFTVEREDGQMVDAEMLRPQAWVDAHGIEAGKWLPLNIPELKILGAATVTAVEPCPEIACGEGSVVTGRFVTRQVDEVARVEILAPDGTTETLEGTPIHPIWSVDRQDWIPLGEISEGEQLQAEGGVAVVLSLTLLRRSLPVYNIEVHGEHVYQVGELGLLVHNAYIGAATRGGHHGIAKFLGGDQLQELVRGATGWDDHHVLFHRLLSRRLQRAGLPPGNTRTADYLSHFDIHPGSQLGAFEEVRRLATSFDKKYGTDFLSGFYQNLMQGRFQRIGW